MKKYLYIIIAALVVGALATIFIQGKKIDKLTDERDRYRENTEILNGHIEQFKTKDSLNAARVKGLELTLAEFEQYRAADAALIKSLKQKNRDLESVNNVQSQTIIDLQAAPRDTVIIRDSLPIKAKAVSCGDAWYDFNGIMTDTDFTGKLTSRDSLIVSETVEHKRFLGFLWKLPSVKNRQVECVNRNPHSQINDIVFVVIED